MVAGAPWADGLHDGVGPQCVGGGGEPVAVLRDAEDTDQWGRSATCRDEQHPGSGNRDMAGQPLASGEGDRCGQDNGNAHRLITSPRIRRFSTRAVTSARAWSSPMP